MLSGGGHKRALAVVGMAPGYHEDEAGKSWVGWSGDKLQKFIEAIGFSQLVDVYLMNALRCRVPANQKPTKKEIVTCRPYLLMDLQKLTDAYEEVIVLACGADAARAVAGLTSLGQGFRMQAHQAVTETLSILSRPPTLFFTYHPAILYPGRKPELVRTIQTHFVLLRRYLTGEFIPNKLMVTPELGGEVPDVMPERVTCDIETYGIMKGKEQTVFNPAKSWYVDGIPLGRQIVTVSFAYRAGPCRIRTPVYVFNDPAHRLMIRKWIKGAVESKRILQGQNFKYDMLYLMANDAVLNRLLKPGSIQLDDTLIKAFLLDEQQPEKSLKELSILFGIASYKGLKVTGREGRATSSRDPDLLYYNCLDSATTLVLGEEIDKRITMRYGSTSAKLGPMCAKMRSDILWNVIGMEKAGTHIDIKRLTQVNEQYTSKCEEAKTNAESMGVGVGGEGSKKSLTKFVTEVVEECKLIDDPRLERTDKKKEISTNQANMNLFLQFLPEGKNRDIAMWYQQYQEYSHLRNTYTNKLLTNRREGIVQRRNGTGVIYPTWYPIPSVFEKGGYSDKEGRGGTIQGRITARKPPVQTFPKPVLACMKSRFPGGSLRCYDLNRIELVVAAWFSGDGPLTEALIKGDPHDDTTFDIFPGITKADPTFKDKRQLAKTLNFLVIYRGGAFTYQTTARRDLGIDLSIDFCQDSIDAWTRKHPEHVDWQNQMIQLVIRTGYIELPTGWSRTFGAGEQNAMSVVNEICNFPIQTTAAQLMLSSQFVILQGLFDRGLRAVICAQTYDAITVDTPFEETKEVDEMVGLALTNPPLKSILESELGRSMPIGYDMKVLG